MGVRKFTRAPGSGRLLLAEVRASSLLYMWFQAAAIVMFYMFHCLRFML